jgi:hypothetical protein
MQLYKLKKALYHVTQRRIRPPRVRMSYTKKHRCDMHKYVKDFAQSRILDRFFTHLLPRAQLSCTLVHIKSIFVSEKGWLLYTKCTSLKILQHSSQALLFLGEYYQLAVPRQSVLEGDDTAYKLSQISKELGASFSPIRMAACL